MARSQEKKIHFSKLNIDTMQAPIQQISTRVSIISHSCYNNFDDCSNNYYFIIIIIMAQAIPLHAIDSSTLTLLPPSVPSSLKFSNRSIAVAVPPLWNKLP